MLLYILLTVIFSLLLIKATDILIVHLRALSHKTSVGGFFIASLLVGLGTSLPELFVGITSAIEGVPSLSLGNVLGANIANVSLIAGCAAIIGGSLHVNHHARRSDFLLVFAAAVIPMLLLADRTLSRIDGGILIILFFSYNYLIANKRKILADDQPNMVERILRTLHRRTTEKDIAYIVIGFILILLAADMIVRVVKLLAIAVNVPILLVGLFLISIGTSLPELIFGIKAVRHREAQMFMGNVFGSIVANSTIVLGIAALIRPIAITTLTEYGIAVVFFLVSYSMFSYFVRTKHRLDRWEGIALVGMYLLFFLFELM